jgi:hypothetical protein
VDGLGVTGPALTVSPVIADQLRLSLRFLSLVQEPLSIRESALGLSGRRNLPQRGGEPYLGCDSGSFCQTCRLVDVEEPRLGLPRALSCRPCLIRGSPRDLDGGVLARICHAARVEPVDERGKCPRGSRDTGRGTHPCVGQALVVPSDPRELSCLFSSCGQRTGWADRDHVIPHAHGGATDCANLCCLCRSHHRLKTLARGWAFVMDDDGTLHVNHTLRGHPTTRPPGVRPPGPRLPAPDPPAVDSRPPDATPDDEFPPF